MNRPPVTPCALVADLESSRTVSDRAAMAAAIESALEDLAQTWPDEWLAARAPSSSCSPTDSASA